ncbi:hypothetical protein SNE40_004077 [Patella caerulea]|uniref:Uncharacterized protein n=1 Tax=Patella caerulea TaxID=87958 RepID=A0AAN8KJP9_PATCE
METVIIPSNEHKPDAPPEAPPDHILFSLISTLFFLPLGIAAILKGVKVRKAIKLNDFTTAEYASAKAAKFAMSGIALGTLMGALVACVIIVQTNQKP